MIYKGIFSIVVNHNLYLIMHYTKGNFTSFLSLSQWLRVKYAIKCIMPMKNLTSCLFWYQRYTITFREIFINKMSVCLISYHHMNDVMMSAKSQITTLATVYSTVCSGADQRKHQSSASLAFVRGFRRWPVNSPHKEPVTLSFDHVFILFVTPYRFNFVTIHPISIHSAQNYSIVWIKLL